MDPFQPTSFTSNPLERVFWAVITDYVRDSTGFPTRILGCKAYHWEELEPKKTESQAAPELSDFGFESITGGLNSTSPTSPYPTKKRLDWARELNEADVPIGTIVMMKAQWQYAEPISFDGGEIGQLLTDSLPAINTVEYIFQYSPIVALGEITGTAGTTGYYDASLFIVDTDGVPKKRQDIEVVDLNDLPTLETS